MSEVSPSPYTFSGGTIAHYLNILLGELLTLIDASFTDPVQRKAYKDILRTSFYDTAFRIRGDENRNIVSSPSHIGEILCTGSRSIDETLDLNEEGKFKSL